MALIALAVLAFAAGLLRQLWSKKYQGLVLDWISAGIDRRTARFGRRYRACLLADLRYVDLKGLAGRFHTPDLDDVYVDVALRPRDPGQVPSTDLPGAAAADLPVAGQRRHIADFLGKPQPRVLAVIGAPGSGKTTLLRHTARQLSAGSRRQRLPVLLYLRDHADMIRATPHVALPAILAPTLDRFGLKEPPAWFDRRLRAGGCLVLLDGLDEVARTEDRQAVSDWVNEQVTRYPSNDFIVTSRPLGYLSAPIDGAITVQTQPFTTGQIHRFVHAWYLAVEQHSTGADSADVARSAAAEADDLLVRLRAAPALRDLTVNPLLLTMIATVHRHHGALPGSRSELYAQICQVLLWRRQAAKKLAVEPSGQQKERLMRVLAFEMMRRQVRDVTTSEAAAILRPALRRVARSLTAGDFLDDAASSGLFVERENGVRAFAHLTFQEYLASAHIRDRNLETVLAGAVGDAWWRETTLLYVAGADAGPIVQACLDAGTAPAITLAFDCADEAGELAEDLRDRLAGVLASGLAPDASPDRRRLMAGVTAARHLRHVIETGDGSRVCATLVTAGLYRYFRKDMARHGQDRPPDARDRAGLGAPEDVVVGSRASDAAAFVCWLNDITGGQPSYRLPTASEIGDPAVTDALAGGPYRPRHRAWLAPATAGGSPRLHLPPGTPRAPAISGSVIRHRLLADFRRTPAVLILLPAIINASLLNNALRSLLPASGPTRDLARDRAFELARVAELARDLACALAHGTGLARDPGPSVHHALDRDLALARDLDRALGRARDLASDLDHNLGRSIDRDLARNFDLARDLDLARGIVRDLVLDRDRDLTGDLSLHLHLDRHVHNSAEFLGRALTQMLANIPANPYGYNRSADGIKEMLAATFADIVAIGPDDCYPISPDLLGQTLQITADDLRTRLKGKSFPSASWTRHVSERVIARAEAVAARREPVTGIVASSLRIMALCLAAEADALPAKDRGHKFRQLAAGITWLELRHSGDDEPAEVIVLALT